MKIAGYFGKFGAPWVDACLARGEQGERISVSLLVDTGAYRTLIGPNELEQLGVTAEELHGSVGSAIGFGGRARFYYLHGVELTFDTDEGPQTEHLSKVLTTLRPDGVDTHDGYRLQSVLGRDVLDRYALYVDKRAGTVLITDEDVCADLDVERLAAAQMEENG